MELQMFAKYGSFHFQIVDDILHDQITVVLGT